MHGLSPGLGDRMISFLGQKNITVHKRKHMGNPRGSPSKANHDHAVAGKRAEHSHNRHRLIVATFLCALLAALALTLLDIFPAKPTEPKKGTQLVSGQQLDLTENGGRK